MGRGESGAIEAIDEIKQNLSFDFMGMDSDGGIGSLSIGIWSDIARKMICFLYAFVRI